MTRTKALFSPLTLDGDRWGCHVIDATCSAGRGAGYFFFARCFEIS